MAASIGVQSEELGRDGSLSIQDHHGSTTLRSGSAQSAQRGKDRLQCAQSNDKSGYASLRSEEVTGRTKTKAWILYQPALRLTLRDMQMSGALIRWRSHRFAR